MREELSAYAGGAIAHMREELSRPYSSKEVKATLFQMGPTKILRFDSMNVFFC